MTQKRLYDCQRWRKESKAFLSLPENCLCAMCAKIGRDEPSTVCDHRIPHKNDPVKFWDKSNWQGVCKHHHDSSKQQLEKSGRYSGCDVDGMPLDSGHIWRKEK